jgi:hypothetical protein
MTASAMQTVPGSVTHMSKAVTLLQPEPFFALNGCLALDFDFKSGRMNMTN